MQLKNMGVKSLSLLAACVPHNLQSVRINTILRQVRSDKLQYNSKDESCTRFYYIWVC